MRAVAWWANRRTEWGEESDVACDEALGWARRHGYRHRPGKRPSVERYVGPSPYEHVKALIRVEHFAERFIELRFAGRTAKGRCPFHDDRTPSFVVFVETQTWRCFGACSTGGDVITLAQHAMDAGLI